MPKSYKEDESLASLWEKATDGDTRAAMTHLESGLKVLIWQQTRFDHVKLGDSWESQMHNLSLDVESAKEKIKTSLATLKARDAYTGDAASQEVLTVIESRLNET